MTQMQRGILLWLWSLDTRSAEFLLGFVLLCRGFAISLPTDSMASAPYVPYLAIMPEIYWGLLTVLAGAAQVLGVVINGRWRRSPHLRMAGAWVGLMWYVALTITFLIGSPVTISIAAFLYLPLAIGSMWCFLNIASKG